MRAFQRIALESQLEIEKLHENSKASYMKSEAAVLYDSIHKQEQAEKSNEEDAPVESETPEEQAPSEDQASDSQDTQDVPVDEVEEEPNPAVEELRGLTYATEDFASTWQTTKSAASVVGNHLLEAGKWIGTMGIEYGPKIASSLYKGVVYVFGKTAKLLAVSTAMLAKYIERRVNSFENLKKSIKEYREVLALVEKNQEDSKETNDQVEQKPVYTNLKVINSLKIGDSVDLTANISKLTAFTNKSIHDLDRQIFNDINAIKHLIAMAESGSIKIPAKLITINASNLGMQSGTIAGYENGSEFTESYKYNEVLPSDIVLLATLPKQELTAIEDIAKAYSSSNMSLGFDSGSFKEVLSVDYMTAGDLSGFLDKLEELCDACIAHQGLYEKIMSSKKTLKFTFKSYFQSLASSSEKVSLKNSLIEYVYLKSMFVDKVYLVAAMDIHDYSARVISYGLSYVKENVKKLS